MTSREFFVEVEENLTEGYGVKMVAKDGFKMKVTFSHLDDTGEPYYVAVGIEGSEFAHISEIFTTTELEKFVINSGFEVYEVFDLDPESHQ